MTTSHWTLSHQRPESRRRHHKGNGCSINCQWAFGQQWRGWRWPPDHHYTCHAVWYLWLLRAYIVLDEFWPQWRNHTRKWHSCLFFYFKWILQKLVPFSLYTTFNKDLYLKGGRELSESTSLLTVARTICFQCSKEYLGKTQLIWKLAINFVLCTLVLSNISFSKDVYYKETCQKCLSNLTSYR